MDFDRHCEEIIAQTVLLTGYVDGADWVSRCRHARAGMSPS